MALCSRRGPVTRAFSARDGEPPGAGGRDFRGERRSNDTHASTTDPDARLYRRTHHGEAKLAYLGHVLMENRNGLAVGGCVTHATGYAEREAALELVQALPVSGRITLGADKALRHRGLRRRPAGESGHSSCNSERHHQDKCHRPPNHPPRWIRDESSAAMHGGANSGVAQERCAAAQDEAPRKGTRRLGLHLRPWRLQSGENARIGDRMRMNRTRQRQRALGKYPSKPPRLPQVGRVFATGHTDLPLGFDFSASS